MTLGIFVPNERVELAMAILECRRQLRRIKRDDDRVRSIRERLTDLEQKLRELDE